MPYFLRLFSGHPLIMVGMQLYSSCDRENKTHLFVKCDFIDHLWKTAEDEANGVDIPLPSTPQSRVVGANPSATMCQSVIAWLSLPANCNPPSLYTVGRWIRKCGQHWKKLPCPPSGVSGAKRSSASLPSLKSTAWPKLVFTGVLEQVDSLIR